MSDNVVFGYPYEGGLWYLLSRSNLYPPKPTSGKGYYRTLYGPEPLSKKNEAVNLAALFDEVLLPPADEYLPDHKLYESGDTYFNPDLRIRVDSTWDKANEFRSLARELLKDEGIARTLKRHKLLPDNEWDAAHIIQRTLLQIRLALENDATYIAGEGVTEFVADLWTFVGKRIDIQGGKDLNPVPLVFNTETLNLIGLDWQCKDIDSFSAVRQSKKIDEYGSEFRSIISTSPSETIRENLLEAMYKAMSYEEISNKAQNAFETTGVASTAVGVIPGLGTPAALIGLKAFLAGKHAERKVDKHRWYLLGAKLREIDLKQALSQRVNKE